MVLTQFELKSCWPEDKKNNMSVSNDIFQSNQTMIISPCVEENASLKFVEAQNGYRSIVSSNGYYGYQPLTTSMKQENFTYNDCEMSMNCDNVQENNIMENSERNMDTSTSLHTTCSNPNSEKLQNQVSVTSSYTFMPQASAIVCCSSSARKRTCDTNYDFKQCSKKSRQQDLYIIKKNYNETQQNIHSSNDDWEILLHNIHGSSSYHWIQASIDLE